MTGVVDTWSRELFADAVCKLLRESRRRQRLTQAQVADRTGGVISKAALANYETGHRSLRVDVLWVIVKALGENLGALVAAAERGLVQQPGTGSIQPVRIDLAALRDTDDPRLTAVRRWVDLRSDTGGSLSGTVVLDQGALEALAALMDVSQAECRFILSSLDRGVPGEDAVLPAQRSGEYSLAVR